ncbi:MAG: hypothetical protein CMQ18_07605 [Gammaproteobacteria bacterium]|nr:hypothetical protein [Gammaproteobacteria bacterium]
MALDGCATILCAAWTTALSKALNLALFREIVERHSMPPKGDRDKTAIGLTGLFGVQWAVAVNGQ